MRQLLLFLGIIATFCFTSCRNELDFESSIGTLTFSKETVYLDTVFTNIGSSTYTLKVYNNSNKNISIPKVRLGKGQSSNYRLMVDGMPGKEFENVELLAKDSLFVFIEITSNIANANPADFLYTDRIEFGETNNYQKVELVDVSGKVLSTKLLGKQTDKISFDISNFASGIYHLRLSGKGKTSIKQIIKQ